MEIKQIIEKYRISLCDDGRLKAFVQKKDMAKANADIDANRPAIVEYLKQKKAAEEARIARCRKAEEVALAVPGVLELREARRKANRQHAAFNRAMERGDGILPEAIDLKDLEKPEQNESATFVLKLWKEYEYMANYELWSMARECFLMFADGHTVEEVKAEYDRRNAEFCGRHFWD